MSKIFNFSNEIIFGQLLETFGEFLLVTLIANDRYQLSHNHCPPIRHIFCLRISLCLDPLSVPPTMDSDDVLDLQFRPIVLLETDEHFHSTKLAWITSDQSYKCPAILNSVTRWLDYFSLVGSSQKLKFAQKWATLSGCFKLCQTQNKPSKVSLTFSKVSPSGKILPNPVTLILIYVVLCHFQVKLLFVY